MPRQVPVRQLSPRSSAPVLPKAGLPKAGLPKAGLPKAGRRRRAVVRLVPASRLALGLVAVLAVMDLGISSPSASASTGSLSGKSATQVLTAVEKAEQAARGVHLVGTIAEGGDTITFDLDVSRSGDGKGTFTEQGQVMRAVKEGSQMYVYANKAFWTKNASAQTAGELGGRWVTAPASDEEFSALAQFFGISRLTTELLPSDGEPVVKGKPTTVGGQKVVPLSAVVKTKGKAAESTTIYVAATGRPYVVKATAKNGDESGTIVFSRYGETVRVKAPADALNLSGLGGSTTTTSGPTTTAPGPTTTAG